MAKVGLAAAKVDQAEQTGVVCEAAVRVMVTLEVALLDTVVVEVMEAEVPRVAVAMEADAGTLRLAGSLRTVRKQCCAGTPRSLE